MENNPINEKEFLIKFFFESNFHENLYNYLSQYKIPLFSDNFKELYNILDSLENILINNRLRDIEEFDPEETVSIQVGTRTVNIKWVDLLKKIRSFYKRRIYDYRISGKEGGENPLGFINYALSANIRVSDENIESLLQENEDITNISISFAQQILGDFSYVELSQVNELEEVGEVIRDYVTSELKLSILGKDYSIYSDDFSFNLEGILASEMPSAWFNANLVKDDIKNTFLSTLKPIIQKIENIVRAYIRDLYTQTLEDIFRSIKLSSDLKDLAGNLTVHNIFLRYGNVVRNIKGFQLNGKIFGSLYITIKNFIENLAKNNVLSEDEKNKKIDALETVFKDVLTGQEMNNKIWDVLNKSQTIVNTFGQYLQYLLPMYNPQTIVKTLDEFFGTSLEKKMSEIKKIFRHLLVEIMGYVEAVTRRIVEPLIIYRKFFDVLDNLVPENNKVAKAVLYNSFTFGSPSGSSNLISKSFGYYIDNFFDIFKGNFFDVIISLNKRILEQLKRDNVIRRLEKEYRKIIDDFTQEFVSVINFLERMVRGQSIELNEYNRRYLVKFLNHLKYLVDIDPTEGKIVSGLLGNITLEFTYSRRGIERKSYDIKMIGLDNILNSIREAESVSIRFSSSSSVVYYNTISRIDPSNKTLEIMEEHYSVEGNLMEKILKNILNSANDFMIVRENSLFKRLGTEILGAEVTGIDELSGIDSIQKYLGTFLLLTDGEIYLKTLLENSHFYREVVKMIESRLDEYRSRGV